MVRSRDRVSERVVRMQVMKFNEIYVKFTRPTLHVDIDPQHFGLELLFPFNLESDAIFVCQTKRHGVQHDQAGAIRQL